MLIEGKDDLMAAQLAMCILRFAILAKSLARFVCLICLCVSSSSSFVFVFTSKRFSDRENYWSRVYRKVSHG